MQTTLILLILIVAAVAGLGFYLRWFNFSSRNHDHQLDVTLTMDRSKFEVDKDGLMNRAQSLGHKAVEKITTPTRKGPA